MTLILTPITDFEVGQKVATHAHTDAFMRGLRFGKVTKVGHSYVWVHFAMPDRQVRLPASHLRITAPAHCPTTLFAPGHPHDGTRCVLGWDHPEQCVFGQHRGAPIVPEFPSSHTPRHVVHQHVYDDERADWWCSTCGTVTDFCTDNNPT